MRGLARHSATLLVVALLVATAAAFAVAERLKLEPSPIRSPRVDAVFSPICDCPTRSASIAFRLRRPATLDLAIVDGNGKVVRDLLDRHFNRGRVAATWDGRNDLGQMMPEGDYRPRIRLGHPSRTIVLTNRIRIDTTPPRIVVTRIRPRVFSPDGDGRREFVSVRYHVSEPAHALLLVNGQVRLRGRWQRPSAQLLWYGRVHRRPLPAGIYRITLTARDLAGNLARATPPVAIRIRYVALARHEIRVPTRARLHVGVSTDARAYRWRLGKRSGVAHRPVLVLRAPTRRRATLVVEAHGHRDSARVIVTPRR